ncbi:MAG TPA: HAD-IA family hydrolase [Bryobacteraceae bacterium]
MTAPLLLIFDLDGTLIDSAQDLAITMNATRAHFDLPPLDSHLIYSYVGNGAAVLVRKALGPDVSDAAAEEGLRFFLRYYRHHALEHTQPYPGVREMIEQLSADGHRLAVLTNKPVRISRDIITALSLDRHFGWVYGGDSFMQKKPDPIGIATLLNDTGLPSVATWMIGDSAVDIQTARNAGVRSCGVAWGFQPEGFLINPPDMLINHPGELAARLGSYVT